MLMPGMILAAPGIINYQGRLTDSSGNPVTTSVNVTFTFRDADSGGSQLGGGFSDTDSVTPDEDGIYATLIGDDPGNLVPDSVFESDSVWLNVNVGGEDLLPRLRMTSVGYAVRASKADTATTATYATLAASATEAGHASTADTATNASHATTADNATEADHASTADDSVNAGYALTAAHAAEAATADFAFAAAAADSATNATTADNATNATHATSADTATEADHASSADFATTATNALALGGLPHSAFLKMTSDACVVVQTTSSASQNGLNLLEAYAVAKALTPGGSPLSATNRAVVIVPPGNYDLGTGALILDTEFIDLVGLSTARDDQYIFGASNGQDTGVLMQTADDVRIENLSVYCSRDSGILGITSSGPAAYFPSSALPNTIVRNCAFSANIKAASTRMDIEYAGAYTDVIADRFAFGSYYGIASGTFTNCTGGRSAFGGHYGAASGTFTNCTGGGDAFGGYYGTASGTFTNCTAGDYSFGGYWGTATGTFADCTGGTCAFAGFNGTASGTFTDCTGGDNSFGGKAGTASGVFINCTGGDYGPFGGRGGNTTGGVFRRCIVPFDWDDSHATTFNGRMEDCRWGDANGGWTVGPDARIYNSTFLGNVDINNTTAGIAGCFVKGAIQNAGSASFNHNNLENPEVN